MKYKITLTLVLFISSFVANISLAQSTKIPFSKGVLKLCSSKTFVIKGHEGKEVIIKSLNNSKKGVAYTYRSPQASGKKGTVGSLKYYNSDSVNFTYATPRISGKKGAPQIVNGYRVDSSRTKTFVSALGFYEKADRGKGLSKLGKKAAARENGIFLTIEQKDDILTIKDDDQELFFVVSGQRYELLVPNSVKLQWDTSNCNSNKKIGSSFVYNTNSSELVDFKGEVEISTSLKSLKLVDVAGPVTINTIGGNVTVNFDKIKPSSLYSIYSNNGFIDIKIPSNSGILIDASGHEILSDLDFNIESENDTNNGQQMKLKLGNGKVRMKLDAGFGNIYLRKK